MADQDFLHTTEIIKAALPYIDAKNRVAAELFIKVFDLLGSLKSTTASSNMAACGYENTKIDVEGLLTGIRPICYGKERDMVDRILNLFNAKRMFEMYNNFMSTMKTMQEFGDFSFSNSGEGSDTDNFANNFKGFNFDSIFGHSSNQSDSDPLNASEVHPENTPSGGLDAPWDGPSDTLASESGDTPVGDFSDTPVSYFDHTPVSDPDNNPAESTVQKNSAGTDSNKSSFGNNQMFDMLKAMMPPEQMSTFENLSMLFNTMSYDNNSKSDDSKEQSNG